VLPQAVCVAASVPVTKQVPVRIHSAEVPNTLSDCVRPVRGFHISAVIAALVLHALFLLLVAFRDFFACCWVCDRDARNPLQDASSKYRPVACAGGTPCEREIARHPVSKGNVALSHE
jgi:hypothetical protein